jgi:predicted ArsR family transcriptional regulator
MDPLGALSSLGDATRRRIYGVVAAAPAALTREEVAAQAGIGRTLAAYHLDRLADDGLLTVTRERRTGRSGPGAGRPAKLYARSEREVTVSIPPRDYHVAARLLADAAAADATGDTARALAGAAGRLGRELAAEGGDLETVLRERGYEPYEDGPGRATPPRGRLRHEPRAARGARRGSRRDRVAGTRSGPLLRRPARQLRIRAEAALICA